MTDPSTDPAVPAIAPGPLDAPLAAMQAAPEDNAARLRYFAALADAPLWVLLDRPAEGAVLAPRVFDLAEGPVVLAFDTEDRMAAMLAAPANHATLPGRVIAAALAGQRSGGRAVALGLNLGSDEAAFIVPPEALAWLAATLAHGPQVASARPAAFLPCGDLPAAFVVALEAKLAQAGGLAAGAMLVGVRYDDGRHGHMLAFVDAAPAAHDALARAVAEALTFSGVEAGEIDVTFVGATGPATASMARVARVLALPPRPEPPEPAAPPPAPGMDPTRPPRLR